LKDFKVLIAEDTSITAADLTQIIEKLGLSVLSVVKTGEEVIECVKKQKPDLILMDIMLQGYYTGIETAEIIHRKYKIPHIFITALNDDETFLQANMTRPSAYILKPFNEAEIQKAIKHTFSGKKVPAKTGKFIPVSGL
jgi:CheY-like chemotaxis protein